MKNKLVLTALSFTLALLISEGVLRLFVTPDEQAWGRLFGVALPPHVLIPWDEVREETRTDWAEQPSRVVVEGRRLAYGDLHGILREDPLLGHAPQEETISANGWWQANNLGARTVRTLTSDKPSGKRRVLVFGDSYAHGSRVPEQETWCAILEELDERIEAWSFGVDGYGMAQAYLKFRQIASAVDHDVALLVFVPDKSMWRDLNTIRYLGEGWEAYKINPRAIVLDGELEIVPSPYRDLAEMVERNEAGVTDELREHLRRYEAYYIRWQYEPVPVLGRSVLFKRLLAWWIDRSRAAIERSLMDPGSEPQRIVRAIAEEMARATASAGRDFHLVILPTRKSRLDYRDDPSYAERWDAMAHFICAGPLSCTDLMPPFTALPDEAFDKGYDNSHYGPRSNRQIARQVLERVLADSDGAAAGSGASRR